jgi:signal transduction histidine kinase
LYSNALKFTDRNGKILILVEQVYELEARFVRISVTDTGIGIKDQDKDRLFKMFGSIKDEEKKLNLKGIGLGLVISKLIVEKFNGYIDFISKFEEGSTFFYAFLINEASNS